MEGLLSFIQPFTVPPSIRERHRRGEAISARSTEPMRAALRKATDILRAVGDLARSLAAIEIAPDVPVTRVARSREEFANFLFELSIEEDDPADEWYVGPELWGAYVQTRAETSDAIETLLAALDGALHRLGPATDSDEVEDLRQSAMAAVGSLQGTAMQGDRLSHEQIDQIIADHRAGNS